MSYESYHGSLATHPFLQGLLQSQGNGPSTPRPIDSSQAAAGDRVDLSFTRPIAVTRLNFENHQLPHFSGTNEWDILSGSMQRLSQYLENTDQTTSDSLDPAVAPIGWGVENAGMSIDTVSSLTEMDMSCYDGNTEVTSGFELGSLELFQCEWPLPRRPLHGPDRPMTLLPATIPQHSSRTSWSSSAS